MGIKFFVAFVATLCINATSHAQDNALERTEWERYFNQQQAKGTIVVVDAREKPEKTWVYNAKRANKRYSPASTFKIPHTLFALDAGVVRDEFEIFPWDGVERHFKSHNQDQNLRSAMQYSALWVYEKFADDIGEEKARSYLKKINYGNADPSTKQEAYWISGNLAISAYEQIAFLKKLYRNKLPFQLEHQRLLKDIMIVEAGRKWRLRAKSGWEGSYGWWVGWVEWPTGPVFFALNIDTPRKAKDLYKREAIVREILGSIQSLPSNPP